MPRVAHTASLWPQSGRLVVGGGVECGGPCWARRSTLLWPPVGQGEALLGSAVAGRWALRELWLRVIGRLGGFGRRSRCIEAGPMAGMLRHW